MAFRRGTALSLALLLGSTLFFIILKPWLPSFGKSRHKQETFPYAFATFLSNNTSQRESTNEQVHQKGHPTQEDDGYIVGVRVLNYALKHNPATRSDRHDIPFVVLVTDDVSSYRRQRLSADGMVVVLVEKIAVIDGMIPAAGRYKDVMTKLRLWTLTKYRKICFIDADTLVVSPLDDVFRDPATELRHTYTDDNKLSRAEPAPPQYYVFAGRDEAGSYEHPLPPDPLADYLNSGFFVLAPSLEMFNYYMDLSGYGSDLTMKGDTFVQDMMGGTFPEQDLLNYAHRPHGPMPWQHLDWRWNIGWPTERDVDAGIKSFHQKFWEYDPAHVSQLKDIWNEQRFQMEGYMYAKDELLMQTP